MRVPIVTRTGFRSSALRVAALLFSLYPWRRRRIATVDGTCATTFAPGDYLRISVGVMNPARRARQPAQLELRVLAYNLMWESWGAGARAGTDLTGYGFSVVTTRSSHSTTGFFVQELHADASHR